MAVRAGMTTLIAELRRLTDVSVSEYTDQQLQDQLDKNKVEIREVPITPIATKTAGSLIYRIYPLPESLGEYFELPVEDVLNDYFYLTDSTYIPIVFGDDDGEAQYDSILNRIVFNADTTGKTYYLTVQSYDLYGAAADIWNIKCSEAGDLIDIKTDNHTLALSQARDFICSDRLRYFASRSYKSRNTRFVRTDQALNYGNSSRLYRRGEYVYSS